MDKFLKHFSEISKDSVLDAGGKGASLGEMARAGIPVPPGFVVLASAFDRFLAETGLDVEVGAALDKVNYKDVNSVDRASNVLRNLIEGSKMPQDLQKEITNSYKKLKSPFVAVRSSATAEDSKVASWAGELETYLNTTEKNLLTNVRKCWSSLFTSRAIFYRHEKKMLKSKVSVAVVVQKMIQSEISGICFTVHPVTEDGNQLLIEAGYGLGEAIVSGSITPDSYTIGKNNSSLLDITVANQEKMITKKSGKTAWVKLKAAVGERQKLSGRLILQLAELCMKVEKHYGFPCDIEWAYEKGKFYITQSRPITTLKKP